MATYSGEKGEKWWKVRQNAGLSRAQVKAKTGIDVRAIELEHYIPDQTEKRILLKIYGIKYLY